jgi:transcriptional regulator with XRE-family HTH domain
MTKYSDFKIMVFEKHKIQFETLGEYLTEVRKELGFSLEDVSDKTSIKINFLENIEAGKHEKLPSDVYVLGFIKQLSGLYSLDFEILSLQYKKEKKIFLQLQKNLKEKHKFKNKFLEKFVITPKSLSLFLGVFLFIGSLIYITWQVLSINKTPKLEILTPVDRQVVKESFIKVMGKTDPGMSVSVNGQNIFVNLDGDFETQIGVSVGPQEIEVNSKNRFEKFVTKNISIIGESVSKSQQSQGVKLRLKFLEQVELTYLLDESPAETNMYKNNETKEIFAQQKIIISTTDAGAVEVELNGKNMGVLGRRGEKISNMPFFAEYINSTDLVK